MSSHKSVSRDSVGLKKVASKGALVTVGSQFFRLIVQLASIAVLARLLSADEYGLMAMTLAVIGIGEVVRDFGLSSAAVQAKTLSEGQKANLFWISFGIGTILALILLLVAPVVALFYGNSSLTPILQTLSITFVINGASAQFRAQLNRDMRFGSLAVAGIAAATSSLVVAVTMALAGFGVWALVGQQLTVAGVPLVVMIFAARWLPGLPRRGQEMRSLVSYGWYLMATQMVGYLSRNVDSVIIGRQFGAEALGFYDRAFQMLMLPLNQLNAPSTTVALPVLSSLQDDDEKFNRYLIRGQTVMTSVVAIAFAFAAAQAADLVSVFLGPGWEISAVIFQILSVAGIVQAASYATYWVFLAKGFTASNLRFALISRPILILLILLGSVWGVFGVAIAYSAGLVLNWLFGLWWIGRVAKVPAGSMFRSGARTILLYGTAGVTAGVCAKILESSSFVIRTLSVSAVFAVVVLILVAIFRSLRADLRVVVAFGLGAARSSRRAG